MLQPRAGPKIAIKSVLFSVIALVFVSSSVFAGRVSVSVSTPTIFQRENAVFTFTNSPVNFSRNTRVRYFLGGSAILGFDYLVSGVPGEIVIPKGSASAQVTLTSISDFARGPIKDVIFSVIDGPRYSLGPQRNATLTIFEVDLE